MIFCPFNRVRARTWGQGMQFQSAVGSWQPTAASNGYCNLPLWLHVKHLAKLPGGGAALYDGVGSFGGWQNRMNNHGWNKGGLTRGGNVLFYDNHAKWVPEEGWRLLYGYEGTTYPRDYLVLRVWGTTDRFGYGPENARLYGHGIWVYLVDKAPL